MKVPNKTVDALFVMALTTLTGMCCGFIGGTAADLPITGTIIGGLMGFFAGFQTTVGKL